jgi:hypothetical protein
MPITKKPSAIEASAKAELNALLKEHLQKQNDVEYVLGDTLDVKTSIALVVIIFLATQSGALLAMKSPLHWHNTQIGAIVCLIIAGVLAVYELFPRTYKVGFSPDELKAWVDDTHRAYALDDESNAYANTVESIEAGSVLSLEKRFLHNRAINSHKSNVVTAIFAFTMASLLANLVTLAALSVGWYF